MQCERDTEAGEHQGGSVGDRGLQRRSDRDAPGREDQPVLGSEAHRSSGPGQHEQSGGGAVQPEAWAVQSGALASCSGRGLDGLPCLSNRLHIMVSFAYRGVRWGIEFHRFGHGCALLLS
jgi:hypothetical protein